MKIPYKTDEERDALAKKYQFSTSTQEYFYILIRNYNLT